MNKTEARIFVLEVDMGVKRLSMSVRVSTEASMCTVRFWRGTVMQGAAFKAQWQRGKIGSSKVRRLGWVRDGTIIKK